MAGKGLLNLYYAEFKLGDFNLHQIKRPPLLKGPSSGATT